MKPRFLLPNRYKKTGWILTAAFLILGVAVMFFHFSVPGLSMKVYAPQLFGNRWSWQANDMTITFTTTGLIIGLLLLACSREKTEDEYISRIRLESLQWAVYVNYFLLLIGILLIYGDIFWNVMVLNMFTVLIIYIIRFNFILYRQKRQLAHEK